MYLFPHLQFTQNQPKNSAVYSEFNQDRHRAENSYHLISNQTQKNSARNESFVSPHQSQLFPENSYQFPENSVLFPNMIQREERNPKVGMMNSANYSENHYCHQNDTSHLFNLDQLPTVFQSPTFENPQNFNPKDYGGDQNFNSLRTKSLTDTETTDISLKRGKKTTQYTVLRQKSIQIFERVEEDRQLNLDVESCSEGESLLPRKDQLSEPRHLLTPNSLTAFPSGKDLTALQSVDPVRLSTFSVIPCRELNKNADSHLYPEVNKNFKGAPDKIPEPRIEEVNVDWILKGKEKEENRQEILVKVPEKEILREWLDVKIDKEKAISSEKGKEIRQGSSESIRHH